ncbi:MAG: hypothetical protein WA941_18100 [Nitrososphaeraceae archaeon]
MSKPQHTYTTHVVVYPMIQHIQHIEGRGRVPIRKAHFVGTSVVVTIDPSLVKRLAIDDLTFFLQKPVENGIMLELKKFKDLTDDGLQK